MGSALECLDIRCDIGIIKFGRERAVRCLGAITDSAGEGGRAIPLGTNPKGCTQYSASQLIDHYDNVLGAYSPCSLFEAGTIDLNPDSGEANVTLRPCCGDNPPNATDSFATRGSDMPQNCTDYVRFSVQFSNGVIRCKQPMFVNDPCEDCKTVFVGDPLYLDIGWKAIRILSPDRCHIVPAAQLPAQQVTSIKIEGAWDGAGKVFTLTDECKNGLSNLTLCLWGDFYHRPTDNVVYDIVFRLRAGGGDGGIFKGTSGGSTIDYPFDGCYCLTKPVPHVGNLRKHCKNWRFQISVSKSSVACHLSIPSKHNRGQNHDGPWGDVGSDTKKEGSSDSPCELLKQAAMDTAARGDFSAGNFCQPAGTKGSSSDRGMPPKAMNNAMGGDPVLFESTVTDSRINTGNCPEGLAGYGSAGSPTTINMWDSNPKGYGLGSFYVSGVAESYSYVSWTGGAAVTGSKILNPSGAPNWYPRMASDGTINACASGTGNETGVVPENYPPGMGGEIPEPPAA